MGRVLDKLRRAPQKGLLLELVLEDVLADMGFQGIRRQQSGTQFGFDLAAWRIADDSNRREIWKFECKNLSVPVSMYDLAPKLIWYHGQATIDRFVLVSTSPPANDIEHFLENHHFSMPIELWSDTTLEDIIEGSPKALKRLDFAPGSQEIQPAPALYLPKLSASLDVVHELNPPGSFDYVLHEDQVIKAYNDAEFRLIACASNRSSAPMHAVSLSAITDHYALPRGRVLTLIKPKGIFEPHKIRFSPRPITGSSIELLQGKVLRVRAHDAEVLALLLEENTDPGLYMLRFEANCLLSGTQHRLSSARLPLHIQNPAQDTLQLMVTGRHYDSPVEEILRLDVEDWKALQSKASDPACILYLGPSYYEFRHGIQDELWKVRAIPVTPSRNGFTIDFNAPGEVILVLQTPMDEELDSDNDVFLRIAGQHPWQGILRHQIRRRCEPS